MKEKVLMGIKVLLMIIGLLISCSYFWEAFGAFFTASGGEPTCYNFIYLPFLLFFPFVLLAGFWPSLGGSFLIFNGFISLFSNVVFQSNWKRFRFFDNGADYFNSPSLFHCALIIFIGGLFLALGIYNYKINSKRILKG